jgi:hypothetical protein
MIAMLPKENQDFARTIAVCIHARHVTQKEAT